jgi:hypothetical protein
MEPGLGKRVAEVTLPIGPTFGGRDRDLLRGIFATPPRQNAKTISSWSFCL